MLSGGALRPEGIRARLEPVGRVVAVPSDAYDRNALVLYDRNQLGR